MLIFSSPIVVCSRCGHVIGIDRLDDIPIGTIFALKKDDFKENRAFCNKKEFDFFYVEHPEEQPDMRK